jgi:hypothetical protein
MSWVGPKKKYGKPKYGACHDATCLTHRGYFAMAQYVGYSICSTWCFGSQAQVSCDRILLEKKNVILKISILFQNNTVGL